LQFSLASEDKTKDETSNSGVDNSDSSSNQPNIGLGDDKPKTTIAGRASRFFRKKD
jgi:hypothetical protein